MNAIFVCLSKFITRAGTLEHVIKIAQNFEKFIYRKFPLAGKIEERTLLFSYFTRRVYTYRSVGLDWLDYLYEVERNDAKNEISLILTFRKLKTVR